MLVSILIPCYNAAPWLAKCIESALAQTYRNLEIILLDDGSTDGSLEIAKQYSERLKIVEAKHKGQQAARNKLFSLSKGEWIQWLDADDEILPEKIERQLAFGLAVNADAVYGDYFFAAYQDMMPLYAKEKSPPHSLREALLAGREGLAPTSTFLWSRAILEKLKEKKGQVWSTAPEYKDGSNTSTVLCFETVGLGVKLVKLSERHTLYRFWSPAQVSRQKRAQRREVAKRITEELQKIVPSNP